MNTIEHIKERFEQRRSEAGKQLKPVEQNAFEAFSKLGIPTVRHEEWKYTRIGSIFNKEYQFSSQNPNPSISATDLDTVRLPGSEQNNELVFVNGLYAAGLSTIRSTGLVVLPLEVAAEENDYADTILKHLGHSSKYLKDGIHALNTAFLHDGVFIYVRKGQILEHPVYICHITDARSFNVLAQPRTFIHVANGAQAQFVENYSTIGIAESFTNQVVEFVLERDAVVEYYKIQNDVAHTSQVSTTHFRQVGQSHLHAVTISLNGNIVRNNLNIVLEAERCEAHLFGLYFGIGSSHIDNHTLVDHARPNCQSNELYKGIIDNNAGAVFNGKIYVQPLAQKTNAYQSNKNILLSDSATVNTKPQLEIFADDVKCSHGCTVGRLDEEGLFYLQSRGIPEKIARSLLVNAFAMDILEHIRPVMLRQYVEQLIAERLEFERV